MHIDSQNSIPDRNSSSIIVVCCLPTFLFGYKPFGLTANMRALCGSLKLYLFPFDTVWLYL